MDLELLTTDKRSVIVDYTARKHWESEMKQERSFEENRKRDNTWELWLR